MYQGYNRLVGLFLGSWGASMGLKSIVCRVQMDMEDELSNFLSPFLSINHLQKQNAVL